MPDVTQDDDFESHRRALTGLAYRMLGSVAEAEDAVQDAFLRWHGVAQATVENPGAYLSTMVTRICLDRLKEARRRREIYVGEWLPEPLVDGAPGGDDPAEDVSVALMLAMERLSPLERAAFILHDVFDRDYAEIASTLGRSEAAVRQLAARARANVRAERPRFPVAPQEGERLAEAFFAASRSGDTASLRRLLADGAVLRSDGGGRALATLRPVLGAERICRFFEGLARKKLTANPRWSCLLRINGLPGWATVERDGTLQTIALEVEDGRIVAIYVTRNPDKLAHIARLVPTAVWAAAGTDGPGAGPDGA